jgi:hypothetical protein
MCFLGMTKIVAKVQKSILWTYAYYKCLSNVHDLDVFFALLER